MTVRHWNGVSSAGLIGITGLVCGVACAQFVQAQNSPASRENGLEEVLVTAQRREENLQSVPGTVTAITATEALNQGVTYTMDLTAAVPGLQFNQQVNAATPFIRGVGTSNGLIGNEPSVATYVDGVYIAGISESLFALNNITRVEVLKGPQGTLFGRNATGGLIQITTKDPTPTPSGEIRLGYANYSTVDGSLYATSGLGDTLAMNVAAYARNQSQGWGKDLVTGQAAFTHRDVGARTKLLWTPDGATRITVSADYNRTRNEDGLGYHIVPPGLGADGKTTYNGFYNTYDDPNGYSDVRQGGVSVAIEQDLSAGRLVNVASWRTMNGFFLLDEDATPVQIVRSPIFQHEKTLTEELHLLSKPEAGIPWIVGFYYLDDLSAYDPLGLEGAVSQPLQEIQIWSQQSSKSYAGFGQVTPHIARNTRLTLGARYTKDERRVDGSSLGVVGMQTATLTSATQSKVWNKPTWRIAVDHHFTTDVMGFVSYDRGFKSGVYNLLTYAAPPVDPEILDAYQAGVRSELAAHRVRLNGTAFYYRYKDIQVEEIVAGSVMTTNAAGAQMKGLDIDAEYVPVDSLTLRAGAELLEGHYTNFHNAPFNDPALDAAGRAIGGNTTSSGNATGFDTVRSPKITANLSADYRIPIRSGKLDFAGVYYYNSGFAWDPDNRLRQAHYHLLNASAAWSSSSDALGVRLWVRNLTGARICSFEEAISLADICSPEAPRTYGVTLITRF